MQLRRRTEGAVRAVARQGFTLMEILIVVAIIVMLAGISGYYVMERYEDAKLQNAKIKVKQLTQHADAWRLGNGDQYPPSLDALAQAQPNGGAPFAALDELMDPWGKPFQYDPSGGHNGGMKPDIFTTGPRGQTIGNWPGGAN
jgi:general secretion pathway protein G